MAWRAHCRGIAASLQSCVLFLYGSLPPLCGLRCRNGFYAIDPAFLLLLWDDSASGSRNQCFLDVPAQGRTHYRRDIGGMLMRKRRRRQQSAKQEASELGGFKQRRIPVA